MKLFYTFLLGVTLCIHTALAQKKLAIVEVTGPEAVLKELSISLKAPNLDSLNIFSLYNYSAQRLVKRGNYREADSLFNKAVEIIRYEPDSLAIMEMMISRSSMYKDEGKFNQALKTLMSVLDYYTETKNLNGQLWTSAYLVEFYRYTSNAELCLKFINSGELIIATADNLDLSAKAYLLCRKASYYSEFINNNDSTKHHLQIALKAAEKANNRYILALNQNEYGRLLSRTSPNNAENILYYLSAARDNMLAEERFRNYSTVLQSIALYYVRNGSPELAVKPTLEAIDLGERNDWRGPMDDTYRLAGEVYYELGQYQQSATYMNKALAASYNRLRESHSIEVNELTASLEKNIAEQKLSEMRIATQIAEERASNNRKALIATIVISLFSIIIAAVSALLFFRFRKKNALLRSQQETIKNTNAKLNDAIDQKNVLYKELNHRVKNNLTILSGLVYLQESGEKSEKQKDLYKTLRERIQSMALVHQNLYKFNEALKINFQEYLRQLIPNIAAAFSNGVKTSTEISCDNLIIEMDEAVPLALIINEIITNSFKHAFRAGTIGQIQLWSEITDGKRVIHYRDNGPGMPDNYENLNTQSLGMRLVKLMTLQLKASLKYEGDENGTYFKLELQ
jgi:two-component sensor histidine kinase/tetratricopeptide (TPR) repeat protein